MTRLQSRLLRHHLPLLLVSSVATALLYVSRPYRDFWTRASFATAYPALALLALTLLMGPLKIFRKRRNPISSDLRRDTGIWAGIFALIHTAIGQNVHLRGRPWLYYVYGPGSPHSFPLRHDLFGFSNYTGAVSCLLIAVLLATSNDYSLRALGTPRWKGLQRWNYAAFVLAAAHTIAYQSSEKKNAMFVNGAAVCMILVASFQLAGYLRRRADVSRPSQPHRP